MRKNINPTKMINYDFLRNVYEIGSRISVTALIDVMITDWSSAFHIRAAYFSAEWWSSKLDSPSVLPLSRSASVRTFYFPPPIQNPGC